MNALKYYQPVSDNQTITNIKRKPRKTAMNREVQRQQKQRRNSHIEQGIEVTIKIIINGLLTYVAFSALVKLIPYHQSQQEKLAEIREEVVETEVRVNKLREKFSRNFDPTQAQKVMQANTHKVDPHQRPIFFLK